MYNYYLFTGFILSIIMIIGIYGFGLFILRISSAKFVKSLKIIPGVEFLIAIVLISVLVSWVSIFLYSKIIYSTIAFCLLFSGFFTLIYFFNNDNFENIKLFKGLKKQDFIFILPLPILYFLSNSGDITNADSIDYHVGYALNYLRDYFDPHPEWYNGRMALIGEKLNAIGLSIGAKQFGSFLQFSGYILIGFLLLDSFKNVYFPKFTMLLAFWASPVFLFLCISAKPQILPSALSALSFLIIYKIHLNKVASSHKRILIAFSLALSSVAFTHKFSFLISYFFIVSFLLWNSRKSVVEFSYLVFAIFFVSLFIITPAYLDKYLRYGSTLFEFFLSPLSGSDPGLVYFVDSVRGFKESSFPFPFYLLVPSSLGAISTVLGVGILFAATPYLSLNSISLRFPLLLIAINVCLLAFFGMPSSRFFLEPYIWLLIIFGTTSLSFSASITKYLNLIVRLQALLVMIALIPMAFFSAAETVGIGVENYKNRYIFGHNLQRWYSEKLPPNASILLDHRSVSLADREALTFEVHEYGKHDLPQYRLLLSQLIKYNVSYVVTTDRSSNFNDIRLCSQSRLEGPKNFLYATRNPFNSGSENGYIFSMEPESFISCLIAIEK